ncbi:MAG TPA: sugar phosphate isomerase/epimerase family protein [Tepidisphaeraceae bacterium]|nr:sugar phosphate isomerase/epimerase family protein [Tepidisphaeraceae bacterium]
MIRIGVRAHDFGRLPPDELAKRIADKGLCCVQLALTKAIAGLENLAYGDLNPGLAWHVGRAFERAGVQIAVLGCYVNPIHPSPQTRRELLAFFKQHLRYARDFGCGIVALETGSVNADYSPHPDNHSERAMDHLLTSIGMLVSEAEKFGVIVGIEGVASHVVSTPGKMRHVLDTIKSNNLQVVLDPVNLVSIDNWPMQTKILEEAIELYGDRVAIIHAKDFQVEEKSLKQVRTGTGQFDYKPLMKWINQRKPGISILLEETTEDTVDECIKYINNPE